MAFSVSTTPWHLSVSHFRPKHFPSTSSISSPTKITLRLALCHAAKKQGGPPVRTNKKKKKKKKLGGGGGRRDGSRGLSLDDDDDNDDGEWGGSSRKIITPPAGFVVDDDDKVLMVSDKRIVTVVDSNNLPLECIIRRVFRSAQGEECMLLCPADMPVRIVKSKNMEGLSSVSVEEVKGLLPTVAYALAKVHMHLVHSGFFLTARGGFCFTEDDVFNYYADGEDADGLPNEGIEITSFNVVLGCVPFPSLGEAYAIVQQEESRSAMVHTPTSDRSALVAIPQGQFGSSGGLVLQSGKSQPGASSGPIDRESLRCNHCHNTGHTRDFCWKLHGRPSRGQGGGRGGRSRGFMRSQAKAHVSESTAATLPDSRFNTGGQAPSDHVSGFSQGEMQALRRLMARADSPSTIAPTSTTSSTSSYFAHTG